MERFVRKLNTDDTGYINLAWWPLFFCTERRKRIVCSLYINNWNNEKKIKISRTILQAPWHPCYLQWNWQNDLFHRPLPISEKGSVALCQSRLQRAFPRNIAKMPILLHFLRLQFIRKRKGDDVLQTYTSGFHLSSRTTLKWGDSRCSNELRSRTLCITSPVSFLSPLSHGCYHSLPVLNMLHPVFIRILQLWLFCLFCRKIAKNVFRRFFPMYHTPCTIPHGRRDILVLLPNDELWEERNVENMLVWSGAFLLSALLHVFWEACSFLSLANLWKSS